MTLTEKLTYGKDLLKARLLNKRLPFAVAWHLTYRCNYNCRYCDIPSKANPQEELTTEEILTTIDGLKSLGAKRIHFCGGECLLREDLGEIIDYCRKKSIQTGLISNGALVPTNINKLKNLYILKLSFDGPCNVQDGLRGRGAYTKVMEAVEAAKEMGINLIFNTTLSKMNLAEVGFILEKAKELDVPVKFSPMNYVHSGAKEVEELLPSTELMKKFRDFIQSSGRARYVLNSAPALDYIADYPQGRLINPCVAGRFFCHIKPNGNVYPCERVINEDAPNCKRSGIEKAFYSLPLPSCDECWCTSTLELNLIYSLNGASLLKALEGNL